MPRVSVVIPTYNYAHFIQQSIDSVISQTFTDFEIIVVDDGSVDNTPEVVRRYGDRVILRIQQNAGLPAARNRGCEIGHGEFIAFLDADDSWAPNKLELQIRTMEEHPDAVMVGAMMDLVDGRGETLPGVKPGIPPGETAEEMLERGTTLPSSWMVRRRDFESVGGFDEKLIAMEDYDFAIRIAMRGRVINLPDLLGHYRAHGESLSHKGERMAMGYVRLFEKQLPTLMDRRFRRLMLRNLAQYRYRLAKFHLADGRYGSARKLVRDALRASPAFAWPRKERLPSRGA